MSFGSFSVDTGCSGMAYRCPRCGTRFMTVSDYRRHEALYDPVVAETARSMVGSRVYRLEPRDGSVPDGGSYRRFMIGTVSDADPCLGLVIVDGIMGELSVKRNGRHEYLKGFTLNREEGMEYHVNNVRTATTGKLREVYRSAVDDMAGSAIRYVLQLPDVTSSTEDPFSDCRTRPELVPVIFCESCGMAFEDEDKWRRHFHLCNSAKNVDGPVYNDDLLGFVGETNCKDRMRCHETIFGRTHPKVGVPGTYGYGIRVHESKLSLTVESDDNFKLTSRRLYTRRKVADLAADHIRTKALSFFDRFFGERD